MSDELRRVFNRFDRLFDRRAIAEERTEVHPLPDVVGPCSARVAFGIAHRAARAVDRGARLKMIVAPNGLFVDGTSDRWDMAFDLPDRRAKLACDLQLLEADDGAGWTATLTVTIRPFPAEGGLLRRMVDEGKLLHRQLLGHWREEMRRTPDLPSTFKDSDAALEELRSQGLDPIVMEFSFGSTFDAHGVPSWRAAGRRETWETSFRP